MRPSRNRGSLIVATASLFALMAAAPVVASPATWERFPLTCGDATFAVTSPPGFWSAGRIVDDKPGSHVVAYAYAITVTDLATGDILYAAAETKPGTRGQTSVECFDLTITADPDTGHPISVDFRTTVFLPAGSKT